MKRSWTLEKVKYVETLHERGMGFWDVLDAFELKFGYQPGRQRVFSIMGGTGKPPEREVIKGEITLEIVGEEGRFAIGGGFEVYRAPQIPWVDWRSYCILPAHGGRYYIQAEGDKDFARQFAQRLSVKMVKLTRKHRAAVIAMHPEWRQAA